MRVRSVMEVIGMRWDRSGCGEGRAKTAAPGKRRELKRRIVRLKSLRDVDLSRCHMFRGSLWNQRKSSSHRCAPAIVTPVPHGTRTNGALSVQVYCSRRAILYLMQVLLSKPMLSRG